MSGVSKRFVTPDELAQVCGIISQADSVTRTVLNLIVLAYLRNPNLSPFDLKIGADFEGDAVIAVTLTCTDRFTRGLLQ